MSVKLMMKNVTQIESRITINLKKKNNIICVKKIIFGVLLHGVVKMMKIFSKYYSRFVITCEQIIEETKAVQTNFDEKKTTCKRKNAYILFPFLLITIALLIDVSIYCYQIK